MNSNTPRAAIAQKAVATDKQGSQAATTDCKELLRQAFELPNKSQRIRFLSERGVSTAEIAKMLGILYQHAYNVLHQTPKRPKTAVAHREQGTKSSSKAPKAQKTEVEVKAEVKAKTKTEAEPPTLQPEAPSEFNVAVASKAASKAAKH